jgi:hypothetical protein
MGGNICKSCDNFTNLEEKDLSKNLVSKNSFNYNYNNNTYPMPKIIVPQIKKRPESSLNDEFTKTTIQKITTRNEEIIPQAPIPEPKVEVDQKEIDKVLYNYRIRLLIAAFRQFKKMKEEAHKIIEIRKNMKAKRKLIELEGNEFSDVDLFPEEKYNFLGNIFNNKEDGFGIQYFPENNAKYIGYFINGRRINYCKFEDKTKFYRYNGETKNNFTGIYGIYYNYIKEIEYEGDWLSNRKDGIGIEKYKDGSIYKGEYKKGVKHGIGVYYWEDGSIYEGEWKYNIMEGYGIYKFKDGSICSGFWTSNQINGFGKFTFPDIKCYIGYFKNDYKSGFGLIFWFKTKKAFVGFWKDNKQHGLGKFINEGKIRYGSWKEGKREVVLTENEFFEKLNQNNSNRFRENIFQMDYDGLKEYIKIYDFF